MSFPANFTEGETTYIWRCIRCDMDEIITHRMRPGDPPWAPTTPEGWRQIPDDFPMFVCPKHAVVLLVDGKPV